MTKWNSKEQKKIKKENHGSNSDEAPGEAMFMPWFMTSFHIHYHYISFFHSL